MPKRADCQRFTVKGDELPTLDGPMLTLMGYHLMIALRALEELQQNQQGLTDRQKTLLGITRDNLGLFKEWLKEFDTETG